MLLDRWAVFFSLFYLSSSTGLPCPPSLLLLRGASFYCTLDLSEGRMKCLQEERERERDGASLVLLAFSFSRFCLKSASLMSKFFPLTALFVSLVFPFLLRFPSLFGSQDLQKPLSRTKKLINNNV